MSKNQNYNICLEAVKQYGGALEYVRNQTDDICLEAVKQNGDALIFVKEQTIKYVWKLLNKMDTHLNM